MIDFDGEGEVPLLRGRERCLYLRKRLFYRERQIPKILCTRSILYTIYWYLSISIAGRSCQRRQTTRFGGSSVRRYRQPLTALPFLLASRSCSRATIFCRETPGAGETGLKNRLHLSHSILPSTVAQVASQGRRRRSHPAPSGHPYNFYRHPSFYPVARGRGISVLPTSGWGDARPCLCGKKTSAIHGGHLPGHDAVR